MKEKDLLKLVLGWLEARRIMHWRNNTGATMVQGRSKPRFVRFGYLGSPDIIACVSGRLIGIECKGEKGDQSRAQIDFQRRLEKAGGVYILCRGLDDVTAVLR